MGNLHDLLILLALGGLIAGWMKLSRAREIAVVAARHHCELHGLQLLDETVGLRAWSVRRIDGRAHLERGYGFALSVDGDDRATGRLWMLGRQVTGLSLPTTQWQVGGGAREPVAVAPHPPRANGPTALPDNVVPLRPRPPRP